LKVSGKGAVRPPISTFPGMLYAVPVGATIANGRVVKPRHGRGPRRCPACRAVFHRGEHREDLPLDPGAPDSPASPTSGRPPFEDDCGSLLRPVHRARGGGPRSRPPRAAADAVRVTYAEDKPNVDTDPQGRRRARRGCHHVHHARSACRASAATPTPRSPGRRSSSIRPMSRRAETHNPIELHATTAVWDGSTLTLYEGVARGLQPPGHPRADVRVAE